MNAVVRGFQTSAFPVWTLPLLYVSGRCLRNFAIKADVAAGKTKGSVAFNAGFQDDVVGSVEQNGKLEDAARQINRIFALCISDRWVIYVLDELRQANEMTGHQWRSRGSGDSTILLDCCSRHISR